MAQNLEPDSSGIDQCGDERDGEPAETRGEIAGFESGLTRESIRSEVRRVMRDPWQRILTDYVGTAPSLKALQKFADKSPDRWIQGAVMLAQLAGYTKEINVNHGGVVEHVHVMSDADLQQRLNEARQKRALLNGQATLPIPVSVSETRVMRGETVRAHGPVSPSVQGVSHRETAVSALKDDDVTDVAYVDVNARKP